MLTVETARAIQLIELDRRYGAGDLELDFPFWMKPIKSSLSHLGFRIESAAEFERARALARQQLPAYAAAFNDMLTLAPGLAGARNTGIVSLDTDLVAFCDDDDQWAPGKLRQQVHALRQRPAAEVEQARVVVDRLDQAGRGCHPLRHGRRGRVQRDTSRRAVPRSPSRRDRRTSCGHRCRTG